MQSRLDNEPPRWLRLLAAALCGWLVFVFCAFAVVVATSTALGALGVEVVVGSGAFVAQSITTVALSALASYYLATGANRRFRLMRPTQLYLTTGILALFTLISFPMPFVFTSVAPG